MDLDKLLEISNQCIHNEPPVCTASCPIHLDVIAFVSEIEKGDFEKAYKLLESRLPLPRLLGKICDHPCERVCSRKDAGGSIHIGELERAVIELGYKPPKKTIPIPKKKGSVAVIGGGLSGLCAAVDLNKKGYLVTIFEKMERIGGRIWNYEGNGLLKEVIEAELERIERSGIKIICGTEVTEDKRKELMDQFDALYLGTGYWSRQFFPDPVTLQAEEPPLFVGGKLSGCQDSVILSASSGKRAAVSIDRYISKSSMTASREREGVYQTLLNYSVNDEIWTEPVEKESEIYSGSEAQKEAGRCLKCQCNECIKACSHMQKFDITPNAYIRRINHNERIILGTHFANKMINSCTECGLCKVQCPVGIGMQDIIHETRKSMVERGKMPLSAHDFALKDMQFSMSEDCSMVRRQPDKEQSKSLFYYPVLAFSQYARGLYKGSGKTGYLFYPGCQLSATHTKYIGELYKHLVGVIKEHEAEKDVGMYLGCCGAPADWAGRQDLMQENVNQIKKVWEEMDQPVFILACTSCMSMFEKYMPMIRTVSLWEILDQYGLPEVDIKQGKRVLNIHDACTARYHTKIHESVRNIAKTLGYKIEELDYSREKAKCCGYGGLVSNANKEQAEAFVSDRVSESSQDLLVYCAMCKDSLMRGNKRVYHILDIIYGNELEDDTPQTILTLSDRHNNRRKLKRDLLEEIWKEKQDMETGCDFKGIIPDDVMTVMDERFILTDDVWKVVDHSRKCNERFFMPDTCNYLARLRLENVTYWVQYEEKGKEIIVKQVYSHRMEILEE
ncbi:heterodisulfide reductase-related iron-sulfur binding cluster [Clostridium boliviensis]|uniref:Heterodisulfide reductase-related iron-sulfur binding cluster n=1 Tax=Clostridium boliviensis TaxID=318465 RepID=A0ABU4GNK2_9CLOT|nr:pyridine nucleotide-disulfide oxidoreductase/dicluster-binding protein [Clostridium boliviensis]MDW2799203.1 heterodisulfide reductase-related iron-sulfur binding cluster [Clostridium boliviensis]